MTLINTLRRMAGVGPSEYTLGDFTYWTDEQLEEILAGHVSARLIQLPVQVRSSVDADGLTVYLHGQIPQFAGTLDTDSVEITDSRGATVDGVTVEADGRLEFDTDQRSVLLYASGLAYDLNAAAAEVCEAWAGVLASAYDVRLDGQEMKRSQGAAAIAKRAATFRSKALPKTVRLTRRDLRRRRASW